MRISPLSRPWPPAAQATFDRIMPPGLEPLALFRVLATSSRAWERFRAGALLDGGPLVLKDREIVILRTCARTGCEYEWGVHVSLFARRAGITEAQITATLTDCGAGTWSPAEEALVATADALHERAALSDEEFARLSAFFDADQILEILMLAGYYRTVACLVGGLALELEPFAARFKDYCAA